MGERKVLNKYIPSDFDPSLVPRGKKLSAKDGTVPVRMMLPFSLQCNACNSFLYQGTKYNAKKEAMGGPDGVYLGITRWRFYIKCTVCARPITFLTDPKHADYEMESGGTRNYEYNKDKQQHEEKTAEEDEKTAKEDPLAALEQRVVESQQEMQTLDQLEELKALNARHVQLQKQQKDNPDIILQRLQEKEQQKELQAAQQDQDKVELTAEDEALVQSIQFGKSKFRRLEEQDEIQQDERRRQQERETELVLQQQQAAVNKQVIKPKLPIVLKKKKRKPEAPESSPNKKATTPSKEGNLAGLLGGYGSSSSDED